MKFLEYPRNNMILIVAITILTYFLVANGKGMEEVAIARTLVLWIPVIIGLKILALYYISRQFTNKRNWIITLVGIIFLLFLGIRFYLDI